MQIEGKIRKSKKGGPPDWVVEVPALGILTQGYTREEALEMVVSAIKDYMDYYFEKEISEDLDVFVEDSGGSKIGISCSQSIYFLAKARRMGWVW